MVIGAIYNFLSKRLVYHTLFWTSYMLIFTLVFGPKQGYVFTFSSVLIDVIFYAIVVYFNIFYLIPNYLGENKFLRYCMLLVLSVALITPLRTLFLYFVLTPYPELQESLGKDEFAAFLLTLMIAFSSTVSKIITDWIRHQRERTVLENQNMQSELRFLKSQINPHFLFNTLNNLYALTLKKSDKAPEIIIKLSEMMRYMLYECNEKQVFLENEVNYIRNYLDLEKLRQDKNVEITFDVYGHVGKQMIAPLMFIPFIENSFKHGLNNHIAKGYVHIYLDVETDSVTLQVENSKPDSLPQNYHLRSGGIGLVNVKRRLNLLYPDQYQLDIDDQPNKYSIFLKLTLDD